MVVVWMFTWREALDQADVARLAREIGARGVAQRVEAMEPVQASTLLPAAECSPRHTHRETVALARDKEWCIRRQALAAPFLPGQKAAELEGVRILQDKGNGRNSSRLATGAKDKGAIPG
jgi:hypothetical protein